MWDVTECKGDLSDSNQANAPPTKLQVTVRVSGVLIRLDQRHVHRRQHLTSCTALTPCTASLFSNSLPTILTRPFSYWGFDRWLWCISRSGRLKEKSGLLYSKKFSSAKNFVKSARPAVCQEFIFVKRRSSLVALRSFDRCFVAYRWFSHSWIFLIPHLWFCEKFSQEFNLVKKLLWRKRRN